MKNELNVAVTPCILYITIRTCDQVSGCRDRKYRFVSATLGKEIAYIIGSTVAYIRQDLCICWYPNITYLRCVYNIFVYTHTCKLPKSYMARNHLNPDRNHPLPWRFIIQEGGNLIATAGSSCQSWQMTLFVTRFVVNELSLCAVRKVLVAGKRMGGGVGGWMDRFHQSKPFMGLRKATLIIKWSCFYTDHHSSVSKAK